MPADCCARVFVKVLTRCLVKEDSELKVFGRSRRRVVGVGRRSSRVMIQKTVLSGLLWVCMGGQTRRLYNRGFLPRVRS